jgi:diadenosine tetraphosphate (Ap4A) HIT family hydrolase
MAFIYQSINFIVEAPDQALVTRTDGGHITITPVVRLADRSQLSPALAIELIYLTMLIGEAMTSGLIDRGVDIGRINYQDNGNWGVFKPEGPYLHYHLYGRAKNAKIHKYGEACHFPFRETGFYDQFEPLNAGDIHAIQEQLRLLLKEDRYQRAQWGF